MKRTTRRELLRVGAAAGVGAALGAPVAAGAAEPTCAPPRNPLPRWRGFNLMPFFSALSDNAQYSDNRVREDELRWIADWGFDYVRLPVDYWFFVDGAWRETGRMAAEDVRRIDGAALERLDRVVEQCGRHGLHLTLNLHRAPGYCINGWEREPFNLWKDAAAEDAFAFLWDLLARRYAGVSAGRLSFNLVNEAPGADERMSLADYRRVMLRAERVIHAVTPDRTVIVDGTGVGRDVVTNLLDAPVAQAFHVYDPFRLTHYRASWVGDNADWPLPEWPYPYPDGSADGATQMAIRLAPWFELARQGVGIHCGEFGCYRHTPHRVFLGWMEAVLDLLRENGIGFALWNFRGDFGVLDSRRTDVNYADWHGHKLDRDLLALLQRD